MQGNLPPVVRENSTKPRNRLQPHFVPVKTMYMGSHVSIPITQLAQIYKLFFYKLWVFSIRNSNQIPITIQSKVMSFSIMPTN